MIRVTTLFVQAVMCAALFGTALAGDYDEAVDGDISDIRTNPTEWSTLGAGANFLSCTQRGSASGMGALDRDYLTITIPPGLAVERLELTAYSHMTELAFAGFQRGAVFSASPFNSTPGILLGGAIYGPADVGTNLLDTMNAFPGVQGFRIPLPAGTYAFWFNQGGFETTATFRFDLVRSTVGFPFCTASVNSTGESGRLFGSGSAEFARNDLTLEGRRLPLNQAAIGILSATQGIDPNVNGLCLGSPIGRYQTSILGTGPSGGVSLHVDWSGLPLANGVTPAIVGETWNFQIWYRDGATSNFTQGLAVRVL